MLEQVVVGLLLDDRSSELPRILGGIGVAVVLALLLAVGTPVVILAGALPIAAVPAGPRASGPGVSDPISVPPATTTDSAPVDIARRYLGVPYVFGGSNPASGLDCSGLVQLVFRQLGIALPRTAQQQYDATPRVARDQLRPGDLVFFARTYADPRDWITHVGIYVGGGQQIDAPAEGRVVSVEPVFSGFWGAHYAGAGRVARG